MAVDDRNPFWADPSLRERFFDIDPVTGRHRRFFDIDDLAGVRQEDPIGLRGDPPAGALAGARGGRRRAADRPPRRPRRSGAVLRAPARGRRRDGLDREDPRVRRAAARLAGDRHGRLRVPQRRLRAVCRSRAPSPRSPAVGRRLRRRTRRSTRSRSRPSSSRRTTAFTPEVQRLARLIDGESASSSGAVASLPVYRTYIDAGFDGSVADEDRRWIERAQMPRGVASRLLLERDAPAEFVTRFQQTTPAVVAKGVEDTAFYRYARLLALCDVGGDPARFGLSVRGLSRREHRAVKAIPVRVAGDDHARHQTFSRRSRADRGADVDGGRVGEARPALAGAHSVAAQRARRPGRRRALPAVSDAGRSVADRARAPRGLHGEGAARGQAQQQLDRAQCRLGARRAQRSVGPCTRIAGSWPTSSRSWSASRCSASGSRSRCWR